VRKHGLAPVLTRDTRVLILGSFPGEASLAAQQYYAHPRNHFWPLLGALLDAPLATLSYRERLATLRAHGVGLWDVIVACERRGSLDGAIRNAERGDVLRVRRAAPHLALVCFNGKTAARAEPAWRAVINAGAAVVVAGVHGSFADKLAAWRAIGDSCGRPVIIVHHTLRCASLSHKASSGCAFRLGLAAVLALGSAIAQAQSLARTSS
jgi:hypoxanthine-DNA glycosylase